MTSKFVYIGVTFNTLLLTRRSSSSIKAKGGHFEHKL